MSSEGGNRYFVIIGPEGAQIQEVPEALAEHFARIPGFASRSQAKRYIHIVEACNSPSPPQSSQRTPNNDLYPNSSTHWEESVGPSRPPTHQLQQATPSPTPDPPAPAPPPLPQANPIILSEEQKMVLQMVKSRRNVFFTGPAGTGKSVLLREIIKTMRYDLNLTVAVTASTGIAGLNIGGSTLHSFAGIGLGKERTEILANRIKNSSILRSRWMNTDVLIIDEISMIDGKLFDKLETIGRAVRASELPFGGLQLVISGDFCQLPPVPDQSFQHKHPSTFAFDAQSWVRCMGEPVLLTHVFRQRDQAFVDILSAMRIGELSQDHIKSLAALKRPLHFNDGIEPSHLFSTRAEVQACNRERLDALTSPAFTYNSMDYRGVDVNGDLIKKSDAVRLLDDEVCLSEITLKVGAQVMLIQNIVQGSLVNGSLGKVVGFMTSHEALVKKIAIVDLRNNRLTVNEWQDAAPNKRPRVEAPAIEFEPLNNVKFGNNDKWPLVEFTSKILLLCAPTSFTVEGYIGNVEAKRVQVPLILAWALSMHKSQGQTLERVRVDLQKVFEKGQAYVAISRATSLEGLEILNWNPAKIEAHPRVLAWQNEWMLRTRGVNTGGSNLGVNVAGPSRAPSTPARGVGLPSPHSMARPAIRPIQRDPDSDETFWDEMDSDVSISHYYGNLPK